MFVLACLGDAWIVEPSNQSRAAPAASPTDLRAMIHGSNNFGISEIGLECSRPEFSVTIHSDGTFSYAGVRSNREGSWTGKVDVFSYNTLAQFIKECDFFTIEPEPGVVATHVPVYIITVVKDGHRKRIEKYEVIGSVKLWAIEQLIQKVVADAKWDAEVPRTPHSSK